MRTLSPLLASCSKQQGQGISNHEWHGCGFGSDVCPNNPARPYEAFTQSLHPLPLPCTPLLLLRYQFANSRKEVTSLCDFSFFSLSVSFSLSSPNLSLFLPASCIFPHPLVVQASWNFITVPCQPTRQRGAAKKSIMKNFNNVWGSLCVCVYDCVCVCALSASRSPSPSV